MSVSKRKLICFALDLCFLDGVSGFVSVFETGSYVPPAGLELIVRHRMTLNFWPFCLHLLSARMDKHTPPHSVMSSIKKKQNSFIPSPIRAWFHGVVGFPTVLGALCLLGLLGNPSTNREVPSSDLEFHIYFRSPKPQPLLNAALGYISWTGFFQT